MLGEKLSNNMISLIYVNVNMKRHKNFKVTILVYYKVNFKCLAELFQCSFWLLSPNAENSERAANWNYNNGLDWNNTDNNDALRPAFWR